MRRCRRASCWDATFEDKVAGLAQVMCAYTRGRAWFTWKEDRKGAIAPGMLADFIVLDRDYLSLPEGDTRFLRPVLTAVGGRVVFEDGQCQP